MPNVEVVDMNVQNGECKECVYITPFYDWSSNHSGLA